MIYPKQLIVKSISTQTMKKVAKSPNIRSKIVIIGPKDLVKCNIRITRIQLIAAHAAIMNSMRN